MTKAVIVGKPAELAAELVRRCGEAAGLAAREGRAFSLAVPGGSAGELAFPAFAAARIDWARAEIFFGDERAVPPDHPDSNHALARRLWLEPARVPLARVHRMPGESPDLSAAAAHYEALLRARLGDSPRLDLALVGVGPDGHVCSLFPGHALLRERTRWVAALYDAPKPPPARLTLTLPVLTAARLVVVVAMGAAKAEVIARARADGACELPVGLLTRGADDVLWLLDAPAAGQGP